MSFDQAFTLVGEVSYRVVAALVDENYGTERKRASVIKERIEQANEQTEAA